MSKIIVGRAPWRSLGELILEGKTGFGVNGDIGSVEVCGLKIPLHWSGEVTYSKIEVV